MEQPVGDPHSVRDEEIEIEIPQIPSPCASHNSSMAIRSQGHLDAYSPREGSPLYLPSKSKKDSKSKVVKPKKVKGDRFFCGLLDKKDGCCINAVKIILIIFFFPFICVYLSVKGIYKKCLVPCCQVFNRCFARTCGRLHNAIKRVCKACQVCTRPVVRLILCIERCFLTTVEKMGSCTVSVFRSIKNCVKPVTDCIAGAFIKVFKCIKYVYMNFCEVLCIGCDGIYLCASRSAEMACKYPEMCCDKLYEILVKIGEGLKKIWRTICEGIGTVIETIVDYIITPIFKAIYNILFAPIIKLVKIICTKINDAIIKPVVNAVKKIVTSLGSCFENKNNNNNNDEEEA